MTSAFHDIRFPLRLSLATSGGPVRRTDIVNLSNGRENRNKRWRDARRSYDAGSGIRSVADLYEVLEFFEARSGQLYGFRFRDPVDGASGTPGTPVTAFDQRIGIGDGSTTDFALTKAYADLGGQSQRKIARPVPGSVVVAVDGIAVPASDFTCDPTTGLLVFSAAAVPISGALVTAGFAFDVPVRFATDRIDVSLSAFQAGRIPSIPLVEILP
jgi:uncharacterized protein (TIGR02217 family)